MAHPIYLVAIHYKMTSMDSEIADANSLWYKMWPWMRYVESDIFVSLAVLFLNYLPIAPFTNKV